MQKNRIQATATVTLASIYPRAAISKRRWKTTVTQPVAAVEPNHVLISAQERFLSPHVDRDIVLIEMLN